MNNKHRSLMFIFSVICVFGSGIIVNGFNYIMKGSVNSGFYYFNPTISLLMVKYLDYLLLFNIIAVLLITSIFASFLAISRMDDITVLITLGGTFKTIQRLILLQTMLLITIGSLFGMIIGSITLILLFILIGVQYVNFTLVLSPIFILIYLTLVIIGTYFSAGLVVYLTLKRKYSEIVDSQYQLVQIKLKNSSRFSFKNKPSYFLGNLFYKRSISLSQIMLVGSFMLVFMVGLGLFSNSVINEYSFNSIDRGFNDNIYVVTSENLYDIMIDLYNPRTPPTFSEINLNSNFIIPDELINQISDNCDYELRLLVVGKAREIPLESKDDKSDAWSKPPNEFNTYLWGIEGNSTLFDIHSLSSSNVMIGDAIAINNFDIPYLAQKILPIQEVTVNKKYSISGVVTDPFAQGNSVYMKSSELTFLKGLDSQLRNVLFLDNPSSDVLDILDNYSVKYFNLNQYKMSMISGLTSFWAVVLIIYVPTLISLVIALIMYSGLLIKVNLTKDFLILRSIGAKPKVLKRTALWGISIILIKISPPAIIISLYLSLISYVPSPDLPGINGWLFLITLGFITVIGIWKYTNYLVNEFYSSLN